MKTYKVTYKETIVHEFYVEANNKEEAEKAFEEGCMEMAFDFSNGEVEETEYSVSETDEDDVWDDEDYIPSAENGDYSPSNPWDAPGMKMSDFI